MGVEVKVFIDGRFASESEANRILELLKERALEIKATVRHYTLEYALKVAQESGWQ